MVFSCTLGVVGATWGFIQVTSRKDENWKFNEKMYDLATDMNHISSVAHRHDRIVWSNIGGAV
jgi:hypothetical protein